MTPPKSSHWSLAFFSRRTDKDATVFCVTADFFLKPNAPLTPTFTHKGTQTQSVTTVVIRDWHTHTHMHNQLVSMLIFTMHINDHLSANKHTQRPSAPSWCVCLVGFLHYCSPGGATGANIHYFHCMKVFVYKHTVNKHKLRFINRIMCLSLHWPLLIWRILTPIFMKMIPCYNLNFH